MGKGGGSSPNTGPQMGAINRQMALAEEQAATARRMAAMGEQNFAKGWGMYDQYEDPILKEYTKILGTAPGGESQQYTNPLMSKLMQAPLQAGQSAAGAASRSLKNMGLGPVATQTGQQQIDLGRMANVQSAAFANVQKMIDQMMTAGGQGLNLAGAAPATIGGSGALLGGASGHMGDAGQGLGQIAATEYKAQQANQISFGSLLKSITSLGTALGSGFGATSGVGQIFGKGGGTAAAGGGSSGGGGSSWVGGYDEYMPQAMGEGGFGAASLASFF